MKAVRRRALWGMFPAAAVLASAVGIAYLGAVSYFADRGLVAEVAEQHSGLARRVADSVAGELRLALDAAASAFDRGRAGNDAREGREESPVTEVLALEPLVAAHPIASQPIFLDPDGRLIYPSLDPSASPVDSAPDQEFLALLSRAVRLDPTRSALLQVARQQEIGICPAGSAADPAGVTGGWRAAPRSASCRPTPRGLSEARRAYARLARHRDTGPVALLGLARLERAAARPAQAAALYRELARRFADRADADGLPYSLIALIGLAEVEPGAAPALDCLRELVAGKTALPRAARAAFIDHVRGLLRERRLDGAQADELAALDRQLALARSAARLAGRLSDDLTPLARSAETEPRGRPALGAPDRTLLYRRLPTGAVVGLALERPALDRLADLAVPARERQVGVRAVVLPVGDSPDAGSTRALSSASFGSLLPHLNLALVQDRSRPDPVAEMVRQRSRRHLFVTGGLVAVLVLGLVATIRGAARERELARLKSDFVSTVSHELKTPLTSIRMFAEMLQQGVAGDDRERERRYHEIIVKESERLGLLIANLLDYAQIERGTRRYLPRSERASDVAREAVATFARLREGEGHSVSLDVVPEADAAHLLIDREVTVQALLNLLSNAVKYGGDHRQAIEVTVSRREDRVALAVRDRGPGIPEAEQERIFREFYRAPTAYSAGVEGTGLGLALVKRHVEAQGGAVELESEPGRGATFTLLFPESPAAAAPEPEA
ncbi:MAG TPA: HAMP domain-containing sensor histidine kinase [Kofleriaceae bacterium]|nr:HAMP domain-containing sensor histidine kinase [Kofleriaceae bacterium]